MMKRGQGAIMGVVLAVVMGVVGLAIVVTVIANTTFTGLTNTVVNYIPVFLALGLMALGAYGLFGRQG